MYRLNSFQKRFYPPFPIQTSYPMMYRPLPEVDPKQLRNSAQDALLIISDANIILKRISLSDDFSRKLMKAAQESKPQIVEQLIKSLGTKNVPQIKYNPDGISLNFDHKSIAPHCCFLSFQLRWM